MLFAEIDEIMKNDFAKNIAMLEWIAAGSPPAQKAEYEARVQRYKHYPLYVLEAEHNRLLAIYEQEDHLFINPQEEEAFIREQALKKEQERLKREREHKEFIERLQKEQREIKEAIERLQKQNRRKREQRNPVGISTDAAPHIGIREIPAGSEDTISREDIEDGDEMVELHGNPKHIFKKSLIDEWISTRMKQFPRNPIKNPYTMVNIKQEDIKRYTAKLKAKAKNGGKRGYNGTRRKYGGYKKSKSLRMRHKVTRSRRR